MHTILNDLSEHEFSGGFCHSAFPPFTIRVLFCVGGAAIYYVLHLGEPHSWAQVVSIFYEENRLAFQRTQSSQLYSKDSAAPVSTYEVLKKNTFCFMTRGKMTSAWAT